MLGYGFRVRFVLIFGALLHFRLWEILQCFRDLVWDLSRCCLHFALAWFSGSPSIWGSVGKFVLFLDVKVVASFLNILGSISGSLSFHEP